MRTLKRWKQKEIGPRLKAVLCRLRTIYLSLLLCSFCILGAQSFISLGGSDFSAHIEQANVVAVNAIFFEAVLQLFDHFGCHYPAFVISVFR